MEAGGGQSVAVGTPHSNDLLRGPCSEPEGRGPYLCHRFPEQFPYPPPQTSQKGVPHYCTDQGGWGERAKRLGLAGDQRGDHPERQQLRRQEAQFRALGTSQGRLEQAVGCAQ